MLPSTKTTQQPSQSRPIPTAAKSLGNVKNHSANNSPRVSFAKLVKTQSLLALQTDHSGLSYCGKFGFSAVKVSSYRGGQTQVAGAILCKNPNCVRCAPIKAKKLSKEIVEVLNYSASLGYEGFFLTLTKATPLSFQKGYEQTKRGLKAVRKFINNQAQNNSIKVISYITIEDTYSRTPTVVKMRYNITTANNHAHGSLIFWGDYTQCEKEAYLKGLIDAWRRGCKQEGGRTSMQHAVDVKKLDKSFQTAEKVADYLAKMISHSAAYTKEQKIGFELTGAHNKIGKGRSFIELLEDIAIHERPEDIKVYKDTINTYYRSQKVFRNKLWNTVKKEAAQWKEDQETLKAQRYLELLNKGPRFNNDFKGYTEAEKLFMKAQVEAIMEKGLNMLTDEEKKQRARDTAEVEIPKDIYNFITLSGAHEHLLELVRLASLDPKMPLFRRFKAFCEDHRTYTNPNRRKTVPQAILEGLCEEMKAQVRVD